ncbi:MAG: hypothetical protein [Bacteriophage sp.]|nr:MAG: hypothetical protein [Bacteriophage sp.]
MDINGEVLTMSERQKVAEMTKTLVNMFPDSKNDLEKEKYYYDHNYFTFYDWEENVIKIILMAA